MKKTCIYCGAELHEQSVFCHVCASSQLEKRRPGIPRIRRRRALFPALAGVAVVALLLTGFALRDREEPTVHADPDVPSESIPLEPIPAFAGPVEPEPEPEVEPTMDPTAAPVELTGPNGTLIYSDSDGVYQLSLSFYRSVGMDPPSEHDLVLDQMVGTGNFTYSQLFVTNRFGSVVNEEFLAKIRLIEVCAALPDGSPINTEGPLVNEEDPLALRSTRVLFGESIGTITVSWTITMENGDLLNLQHVLTIVESQPQPIGPIIPNYLSAEDCFLRRLSDEQLAALKDANADTLQAEISTIADAVAYLDQFPHGRDSFFDALDRDFLLNIEWMLDLHRGEATGPDVYTSFTGWCLADDYPESRYIVASGDSHGFTWIYHGLLLPTEGGWHVTSPAGHSVYWNTVYGFDEMTIPGLEGLESRLIPHHAGMSDDSDLFLYHLFTVETGRDTMNFWLNGNYIATDSGAEELYRR